MSNLTMDLLINVLSEGDQKQAVEEATNLLNSGVSPERIVTEGIEVAMTQLDAKCTIDRFNLLDIMLVGRAAMIVMKKLYPLGAPLSQAKGIVVLASLEGDIHDLGKNILKMILTTKGYRIIDCGKDCPLEKLIDTAEKEDAQVIGLSGLITTVIPRVRQVKELLADRALGHIQVMAGGAALKQATAESLNVDFVADTAFDGVHYLDQPRRDET